MKCNKCGFSLASGARFCLECGQKVIGAPIFALAPLANSLRSCGLAVVALTTEEPDSDGEMQINVRFEVTNPLDDDLEYLDVRTQIISAAGLPIEESRDPYEQTICAGETIEFQTSIGRIKPKILGDLSKVGCVVSLVASRMDEKYLGEVEVPSDPLSAISFTPTEIGDTLKLHSVSLWKTEPDKDKESIVELKALVQNLRKNRLPLINVLAPVTSKAGHLICDLGGAAGVEGGSVCVIRTQGSFEKAKKFENAKVGVTVRVYLPVAAAVAQLQGLSIDSIESSEASDEASDSVKWPFDTLDEVNPTQPIELGDEPEDQPNREVKPTREQIIHEATNRFADGMRNRVHEGKYFIHPGIPEKKLKNALEIYAIGVDAKDVIALVDSTTFGSAKDGLLVTSEALYAKDFGASAKRIFIEDVEKVAFKSSQLLPQIMVNGNDFLMMGGLDKAYAAVFAGLLDEFCNEINSAK